jgi:hypothetical protein
MHKKDTCQKSLFGRETTLELMPNLLKTQIWIEKSIDIYTSNLGDISQINTLYPKFD